MQQSWPPTKAAEAAGVCARTARKWVAHFKAEGQAGQLDRFSAPKRIRHRTPVARVESIKALRKLRMTAAEIAEALGWALSTVSLWPKRVGLGKRSRLEPPNRFERRRPGELVHVDVKKLGRFGVAGKRIVGDRHTSRGYGWDFVHVMVDDRSRLAYAEVLGDERGKTAAGFLRRGLGWFARLGWSVALVTLDPEVAVTVADPEAEVVARIERANERLARVEQIKRFAVLLVDWAPGGDELTPTMKLRRWPIAQKYSAEIDALYA